MNFKKNGGFTLVEMIVVIAILGILAGIGIPQYSKYVEKAQIEVEEQNINMFHNAFVVACVGNGADPAEFKAVGVDMTNGVFKGLLSVQRAGENEIVNDFNAFFGFPTTTYEFKHLADKVATGILKGLETEGGTSSVTKNDDGTYTVNFKLSDGSTLALVVDQEVADKLKNNTFADSEELGADVLLGKVDTVAGIASSLLNPKNLGKPNSVFEKMLYGTDMGNGYAASLFASLGFDETDEEAYQKFVGVVFTGEDADGNMIPNSSVLANSLVLTAAQKTQGMDTSFLGTSGSAETLRQQLNSTDLATSTDAMAKLALTYGMYTSYVNSAQGKANGATDETAKMLETGDFSGMTAILGKIEGEDSGFNAYLASDEGKADLAAYQASMKIINDAANESPDAAMDILANGFDDPDLSAVLGSLMGNK